MPLRKSWQERNPTPKQQQRQQPTTTNLRQKTTTTTAKRKTTTTTTVAVAKQMGFLRVGIRSRKMATKMKRTKIPAERGHHPSFNPAVPNLFLFAFPLLIYEEDSYGNYGIYGIFIKTSRVNLKPKKVWCTSSDLLRTPGGPRTQVGNRWYNPI